MIKLSLQGVGNADHPGSIRDTSGTGLLPVQASGDGATTFQLLGRVSPEAPWVTIKDAATASFLESISWVPYVRLQITAGTGAVTVWIGEK